MKRTTADHRRDYEAEQVRKALARCEERGVVRAIADPDVSLQLRLEALEGAVQVLRQEVERLKDGAR
jgi:hypothetical protein